ALAQRGDEPPNPYCGLTERALFSKRLGIRRRRIAVLHMHRNHPWSKQAERLDRVAGTVHDHVGWVEVYAQVGTVDCADEVGERLGALLPRFEREHLPVLRGVIADASDQVAHGRVLFVYTPDVAGDRRGAKPRGEIAHL